MTEKEKLMKSYEDLTAEEIRKTLDFVLALKAQRTQEPGELLLPKDPSCISPYYHIDRYDRPHRS